MLTKLKRYFAPAPTRLQSGRMAVRDCYRDIRGKIESDSPVIVDGGANTGSIIDLFLEQYASPTIHAFEPIPQFAQGLMSKYQDNPYLSIHACALGAENKTIAFHVLDYANASSVFAPSQISHLYHGSKMNIRQTTDVQMVRLDTVFQIGIDILKLDLQGYELEALKGCENLFEHIKTIVTEVAFVPLYEGQPLFGDIDSFLRSRGFQLLNLYDLWTHSDGQLTAGDAIFLNRRFF